MATAKKRSVRTAAKKKKQQEQPSNHQVVAPRTKVFICDEEFWSDAQSALNVLIIEMATAGMSKEEFAEFSARFRLKLELWKTETGNEKLVLCENGVVFGDWLD
jgi:hypothetical protein